MDLANGGGADCVKSRPAAPTSTKPEAKATMLETT
jgi:hypothetical protein